LWIAVPTFRIAIRNFRMTIRKFRNRFPNPRAVAAYCPQTRVIVEIQYT
jgi:hypothetical protein